ncbi:MAG: hypothetical protein GWP06_00220 [Actinobacteria bacterium]|nr:hypothetical protein [Actinomycetota bacterium]
MNVLSLFDGMACGLTALKKSGIKVDNYYASEIDKWAMKIAVKNHPEVQHIGDVEKIYGGALGQIGLFLAGPPCQGFSCSGSRLDFEDPRSKLFFKAIEIIWDVQKINPGVKFLIENVSSMRKEVRTQLTELLEVEPIEINSNLVSAQNRNRLYWTNLPRPGQPKDKGIFLKDILEPEVDDKYYLHENSISGKRALKNLIDSLRYDSEKSRTITSAGARKFSGSNSTCLIVQNPRGKNAGGIKAIDGKTPSLSSSSWVNNNHLFEIIRKNGDEKTFIKVSKKLTRKPDQAKASCLTGGGKAAGDHSAMDLILYNDFSFRRLTPIECERLQTLTSNRKQCIIELDNINSIMRFEWFAENLKNNAQDAEERCLKSLKNVGNAEKIGLKEFVQYVENSINQKNHQTKKHVALSARINLEDLDNRLDLVKGIQLNVSSVEKSRKFRLQKKIEDFVLTLAGILMHMEKTQQIGRAELRMKEMTFIQNLNGKNVSKAFGNEIKQLAEDAEKNSTTLKKLLKYIISNPLNMLNIDQCYLTLFCYVMNAINGFIPEKTSIKILLEIESGYTYGVSNTQRYKALGNGWTVDIIAHILAGLND